VARRWDRRVPGEVLADRLRQLQLRGAGPRVLRQPTDPSPGGAPALAERPQRRLHPRAAPRPGGTQAMTQRWPRRLGGNGRHVWLVAVCLPVLVSAAGADPPAAPTPAPTLLPTPAPAPEPEANEYRIGPEDVLQITVWQNAELSRILPVRPDGKISLPLVNDVQAAGLTPMQLRDALKQKLAEYAPAAEISVIVGEVQSFNVSLIGKVQRANRYKLKTPTTVLDLLALAGGFAEFADPDRI